MPAIGKKNLYILMTRVEVAEKFIMEDTIEKQQDYLECLDTYGAFSKEVYKHIQAAEPVSEVEEEAKYDRALKAFDNSYIGNFYIIIAITERFKNARKSWGPVGMA